MATNEMAKFSTHFRGNVCKAYHGRCPPMTSSYLGLDDVEGDDAADLGDDGDDDGEQEEPDETGRLGRAADPPDEAREEEGEAKSDDHVGENLEKFWC